MSGDRSLLQLSVGVVLRFDGLDWTVEEIQAQRGRVVLRADSGERQVRTIKWLMHHPECRIIATGSDAGSAAAEADSVGRQPPTWRDLTPEQQDLVRLRVGHLLEVETGFRCGDPRRAAPDEPRAAYDPRSTTSGQRRRAKVAELKALGAQEAALLGLHRVSERTLKRMAAGRPAAGLAGCVDGRWLRAGGGHPSIIEPAWEAMFAVRAESLHRSRMSMRAKQRLIHQYVLEKYGPDVAVPGYDTLRAVWAEWFGPGGAPALCPLREHCGLLGWLRRGSSLVITPTIGHPAEAQPPLSGRAFPNRMRQ